MPNKSNQKFNMFLGILLQDARKKRNVTQQALSKKIGLSQNQISAIERGACKASIETLYKYCEVLNFTPNEIFNIKDDKVIGDLKKILETFTEEEQRKILEIVKNIRDINQMKNKR